MRVKYTIQHISDSVGVSSDPERSSKTGRYLVRLPAVIRKTFTHMLLRPIEPFLPMGSINQYQLWLGDVLLLIYMGLCFSPYNAQRFVLMRSRSLPDVWDVNVYLGHRKRHQQGRRWSTRSARTLCRWQSVMAWHISSKLPSRQTSTSLESSWRSTNTTDSDSWGMIGRRYNAALS